MKIRFVLIPHGSKLPAKDAIAAGFSPADPPLTEKAQVDAVALCVNLGDKFGQPNVIFSSPKHRARQTAQPAIECFGQLHRGGCLVVELNILSQPDSGEVDRENSTRPDGLVIYGDLSTEQQWHKWTFESFSVMAAIVSATVWDEDEVTVWVYTHSPHAVCARRMARLNAANEDADTAPVDGEIMPETFDPAIKPYIVLEMEWVGGPIADVTSNYR